MSRRFPCFVRAAGMVGALAAFPAGAQAQETVPQRPRLAAGADTNSAGAYYQFGLERLRLGHAHAAADAFCWASRLAPDWADPLYARRVALILARPERLVSYMEGMKSVLESPEVLYLDSLHLRALLLDPFLYEDLDREVVMQYLTERTMLDLRRRYMTAEVERLRSEVEYEVGNYLRSPKAAWWRAWLAYAERRLADAAKFYAEALRQAPKDDHEYRSRLLARRGRALFLGGRIDSAGVALSRAIDELRRRDEQLTMPVYESKAMLEHSLGVVLERAGDLTGAREAYGRALVEDLAFHPAHVKLGGLLAAAGDTAGARKEYELALDVAPEAVVPRMLLADHYHRGGDHAAALRTLEPLREREPYYAEPCLLRALAYDRLGNRAGAAAEFRRFLDLGELADDRREAVTRRLAVLEQP